MASLPYVKLSTVVLEESSIFLAFFENLDDNKAAAAFAVASIYQVSSTKTLACHSPFWCIMLH